VNAEEINTEEVQIIPIKPLKLQKVAELPIPHLHYPIKINIFSLIIYLIYLMMVYYNFNFLDRRCKMVFVRHKALNH
jgi:hypothetical protein